MGPHIPPWHRSWALPQVGVGAVTPEQCPRCGKELSPPLRSSFPRTFCIFLGFLSAAGDPVPHQALGMAGKKPTLSFLLQKAHMEVKSPDESANQENLLCLSGSTYSLTFFLIKRMIIKIFWLKEAISGLEDAISGLEDTLSGARAQVVPLRLPRQSPVGHSRKPGPRHSAERAQNRCKSG